MNYKHWLGIVVVVFVCLYVWKADLLKTVPILGPYVSA